MRECEYERVHGHHIWIRLGNSVECAECGEPKPEEKFFSSDNYPVEVGRKFWNNDLRVCQITMLESIPARPYADSGCTATWHRTTHGDFDTLTGSMRPYGRLGRYFQGKDAEDYEPGTNYADIKGR